MTPMEKLDAVLNLMASDKHSIKNVQYDEVRNETSNMYPALQNNIEWDNDVYRILRKLCNEGYVTIFDIDVYPQEGLLFSVKEKRYMITFDGKFFSEQGGYKKQAQIELNKRMAQRLALWLTAIGTMLAGLYGVFEMTKWAKHHIMG